MKGGRTYYAHTAPDDRAWEPLHEHLALVARRARSNAEPFGAGPEAYLAGLLHDLGKYGDCFQQRLRGLQSGVDHWALGSWVIVQAARNLALGWAAALAIAGHHVGLQSGLRSKRTVAGFDPGRIATNDLPRLIPAEEHPDRAIARMRADGLDLPDIPRSIWTRSMPPVSGMLATRMLFSALVDADYLETEAWFGADLSGQRAYRPEATKLDPQGMLATVQKHVADLKRRSSASEIVDAMRAELLRDCIDAGHSPRGSFTLTAPTGSGKTIAMLAFALAHAAAHGLRRIVIALPFLSIIEQTAHVYRRILGSDVVVEDHSLCPSEPATGDLEESERDVRRTAENWDAPIVVTTNVQLLESLFAHRPRRCRKLHNLANSVVLFDETQNIPLRLACPALGALGMLARRFGCSVVFATATQPAFDRIDNAVRKYARKRSTAADEEVGWNPREIVRCPNDMFRRVRRTRCVWDTKTPVPWDTVAENMINEGDQSLAVVNLKRHAKELVQRLSDRGVKDVLHLSTNLCPAHRTDVLEEVRRRLAAGEPCRLVSTQCIEAGVDIDFPVVMRALAPLEAIAQAAGRCNRNGRSSVPGRVLVFLPEDEAYPGGLYQAASGLTKDMARQSRALAIDDPDSFRRYYARLLDVTGAAEKAGSDLEDACRNASFPDVARLFRLIEKNTIEVVVPWDRDVFDSLRAGVFDAAWVRRARPVAVSIYQPKGGRGSKDLTNLPLQSPPPTRRGKTPADWYVLDDPSAYDSSLLGLDLERASPLWIG